MDQTSLYVITMSVGGFMVIIILVLSCIIIIMCRKKSHKDKVQGGKSYIRNNFPN